MSPNEGQVFSATDGITLRWQPVGQLEPDEYYVTTVAYHHLGETWYDETPWLKDTSWNLSDHGYLRDLSDDSQFRWAVQIMRRTGINAEGKPEGIARSPLSEVRTLIWQAASPGGGGTPPPPKP
jgi:hypothetical protein